MNDKLSQADFPGELIEEGQTVTLS